MPTFTVDVSEHQGIPIDDTYNREWFKFRLCFDGNIDDLAVTNLARAKKMHADGKLRGFSGYVVPLSGQASNDRCMAALDQLGYPHDQPVLIDGEKWGGAPYEIFGDHSAQFNDLARRVRARQGGRDDMAWAYGNRGPDLIVWPNKADWLGWLVASYTSGALIDPATIPNMIGQQYTDGQPEYDNPTRPHSTPPFGRCDHNILYRLPEGDTMPTLDEIGDEIERRLNKHVVTTEGDKTFTLDDVLKGLRTRSLDAAGALAALDAELDALPTGADGGLTKADVIAAVRKVFGDAANATP